MSLIVFSYTQYIKPLNKLSTSSYQVVSVNERPLNYKMKIKDLISSSVPLKDSPRLTESFLLKRISTTNAGYDTSVTQLNFFNGSLNSNYQSTMTRAPTADASLKALHTHSYSGWLPNSYPCQTDAGWSYAVNCGMSERYMD